MVEEKNEKNERKYVCETCDYVTRDKQDYNIYLSTRKHKMVVNGRNITSKNEKKYFYKCGNFYFLYIIIFLKSKS